MKRLHIFLFLVLIGSFCLYAQEKLTMKTVLVICDDYVSAENNQIADGVKRDKAIVQKFLDRMKARGIVDVEASVLEGKNASSTNLRTAMKSLKVGSNDILFFYFSGHGGMEKGKTFLYFTDEEAVSRDEIVQLVQGKNARFSVMFTVACSSSIESVSAPKSLKGGFKKGMKDDAFDPVFKELFHNYRGLMHMSAAKEGQYATGTDTGGIFTIAMVNELLMYPPSPDWNKLAAEAAVRTDAKYKKINQYSKGGGENDQASQDPQVYSYPKYVGKNANVATNTAAPGVPATLPQPAKPSTPAKQANHTIKINNESEFPVVFYDDRNEGGKKWSASRLQKHTVKAGGAVTLTEKDPITVYYNFLQDGKSSTGIENDEEKEAVELEDGEYFIAYDDEEETLSFYTADDEEEEDGEEDA